jgi:hypothetical protein
MDNWPAAAPRQGCAITQLYRETDLGAVDDGLAMKADYVHFRECQTLFPAKCINDCGVPLCKFALGLGKDSGACHAIGEGDGLGNGILQQSLLIGTIGKHAGWTAIHLILAIAREQGNVDAIERCARHEAEGRYAF